MSLLFGVADLLAEVEAFRTFAARLLAGTSDEVLRAAARDLTGISRGVRPRRWQVHRENPVVTAISRGSYMPDEEGELTVSAEISFVWDLEPVRSRGDSRPAKRVRLNGLGSTEIRILKVEPYSHVTTEEIAHWKMEVADSAAPGAFFHVQVQPCEAHEYFPKSLDVPRLPAVLNSPFACMEFVLGELFQDEWPRLAMRDSGPGQQWRSIQAFRHQQHLDWIRQQVADSSGSPWVMWKRAKPHEGIFLR